MRRSLLGRRNVEGGPRQDNYNHEAYRGVLGLRGEIVQDWNYDVYGLYGTTNSSDYHANDTSSQRIQNALLAVRDPKTGAIVCQGGQTGCVPWNIFNPAIPITQDQISYISVPGIFNGTLTEYIADGFVSGDLTRNGIKLPWADSGLKVVFGTEYRAETLATYPDNEYLTADLAGLGSPTPPVNAGYHVWEAYTEERLPIIKDGVFAKALDFETGYRYSNYTVGYSTNTYKFGLEWEPINDFRLRGSYNRAVRAPNIQELYQPQHVGLDSGIDGCAYQTLHRRPVRFDGLSNPANIRSAGSPAGQYNGRIGGNTGLQPETATTRIFGLVFTPTFLPNFSATFDWVDIRITNLINSYGSSLIEANCIASGSATSSWCRLIHRDAQWIALGEPGRLYHRQPPQRGRRREQVLRHRDELQDRHGQIWRCAHAHGRHLSGEARVHAGRRIGLQLRRNVRPGLPTGNAEVAPRVHGGLGHADSRVRGRHELALLWSRPPTRKTSTQVPPDYMPGYNPTDDHLASISYFDVHTSYVWNKATFRAGCEQRVRQGSAFDRYGGHGRQPDLRREQYQSGHV